MRRAASLAVLILALLASGAVTAGAAAERAEIRAHSLTYEDARSAVASDALPVSQVRSSAAATWCGTAVTEDLAPNAVAGYPVHWIYAIPSDGPDQLPTVANAMQADAEQIDAWWRSQDPTRVPRNDVTQLSCGLQLDLTTLRLPLPSAQLAGDGLFRSVFDALIGNGFRSPLTKYVVYFDGPVGSDRICGQGGSDSSGFGLAVVYIRACGGVSTAAVAAHELLHTFGAVPSGAPHECPEPNDSHTCDDPNDLMNPFIDESPLASKTLDPGRDDYYGHAGSLPDSQDSPWLVQLDRQVPLPLAVSGPGSVQADVPGLSCGESCSTTWNADTRLQLTGVPANGAKLVRWSGSCSGASLCSLSVAQGATVSALFAPLVYRLRVTIGGRGSVRSARPGITCRPRCSAAFPSHTPLRLTAKPAQGWRFRSWTGACRGRRLVCTVPMTAQTNARAVFVRA